MFWNNNMKNNRILKNMFVMGGIASSAMGMAQHCPNVLVIMTDEHNFRTLGCYREQLPQEQAYPWGKEVEVKTPHIDALASRGALCLNYYATHPVSGPSRGCFISENGTWMEAINPDGHPNGNLDSWTIVICTTEGIGKSYQTKTDNQPLLQ